MKYHSENETNILDNPQLSNNIRYGFLRLRPRADWAFRNIERKEMSAYSHGYHRYPAKFIPHIVRRLIGKYAPNGNEMICDPFGGCGTTLVEAKLSGRKSVGFDINPIAKLITQVKVTPINPQLIEKYSKELLLNFKKTKGKNVCHHPRVNYWFNKRTIKTLDKIYLCVKKIKNIKVRRFFLCAFSHNLKNSSRWLMKSIKPQIDPNKVIPRPIDSFLRHLDSMTHKNMDFYNELAKAGRLAVPATMCRRDSTRKLPLKNNSVDLIVTSPPYVTSYEYADLHQLSLLWLGDDHAHFKKWHKFSNKFHDFRKQFIGTSYKNANKHLFKSNIAETIVSKLTLVDRQLAANVGNYFSDMQKAFSEMYRLLKIGGKACVIIGNTNLRGVDILNAEVAAEQMTRIGFSKISFVRREVLNTMIAPWRDRNTGKFTNLNNPSRKRIYGCEYVVVMEK